jgi:HSP20 family protein
MSERDLFANFERMRREMDELFGDVFERSGLSRRQTGHWPAVDVAYASEPPRAIVTAQPAPDGYQQIEIERGSFRRLIELGADVDADRISARYEDGMLRVELPLVGSPGPRREVPIQSGETQ